MIILIIGLLVFIIVLAIDTSMYVNSPYYIRSGHWWSYLPGGGFYARYLTNKNS